MNIFKILSSYDGTLKEPNISAFLSYLIDPNEDHGLGNWFVIELMKNSSDFKLLSETTDAFRSKLENGNYTVNIKPEFTVESNNNKRRDIDILIEIFSSNSEKPSYAICLENKIYETSIADKNQLIDEMIGLQNLYNSDGISNTKIGLIYLIPKLTNKAKESFEKVSGNKKCIFWKEDENSISFFIKKILQLEADGRIDPVYDTMKYTLRSFLSFIENDFKSTYEYKSNYVEKQNYGKPVIEYITDIYNSLDDDQDYEVKEIKEKLSKLIYSKTKRNLDLTTRNCQMYQVIVNDMNRTNYAVKNPEDMKYNLFYYPNTDNRKVIKKFSQIKR